MRYSDGRRVCSTGRASTSADVLRVVYLHVIGEFGGASRSLFEAVRALPAGAVEPVFITPRGSVQRFFEQLGPVITAWGISKFDHTRYTHYRALRWLVLLREMAFLPATALALWRARRVCGPVDLLHLNEFTGLPVLWLAERWLRPRATVIHVRSLTCDAPGLTRTRWLHALLRRANAVVAIDESVRATLPADLRVDVIHNAFTPSLADMPDTALEERLNLLRPESFKVGFVGNLLRVKGIDRAHRGGAHHARSRYGCGIRGGGRRCDVPRAGRARGCCALWACIRISVPRWRRRSRSSRSAIAYTWWGLPRQLRGYIAASTCCAFRRTTTRPAARFSRRRSSACRASLRFVIRAPILWFTSVTGLAFEPGSARQLADAIERLALDRDAARRMGAAALEMAERNFNASRNAAELLACTGGSCRNNASRRDVSG